ncbi:uncharacterized protein LOC128987339 [Macrosteles quadrilineatus]|uniref:uncharacterized protein LOC128987339 n=1 Tax=Macrosteles quadrilineatus TaxID=74068 RepID=UPI0023E15DED|nr:uncharacterized protein LOC128987339 [Macrosteles quadrilineatus]
MDLRVPNYLLSPCVFTWFLVWGVAVTGLRDVRVRVPEAVSRGQLAILYCDYDLEGDALYSVKWYIGRREFYRFTPREHPKLKVFPIQGLSDLVVQRNCSNARQLCLHKVTLSLSGRYSCEVSADSPSFRTAQVSAYMDVVVVPSHRPELEGMRPRYRVGDTLSASCISRHSKPPANLTWSINGSPLRDKEMVDVRTLHETQSELVTGLSTITVPLTRDHFTESGRLKVRCTASLYTLYWQITENSAELERPRAAVVAASNQGTVDTRAIWRAEEKLVDQPTTVQSSSTVVPSIKILLMIFSILLSQFVPNR